MSAVPSMRRLVSPVTVYPVTPVPFTLGPLAPWSWYVRWPHSPPFLIPPATPKFPFAPDGVPVIQPPPVANPGQPAGGGGGAGRDPLSPCAAARPATAMSL